jgi:hypothetical protein
MINIIFINNTMIRILAIELLNRILILIILMIKSLLKKVMVCLNNFSTLFSVNKVKNRCAKDLSERNMLRTHSSEKTKHAAYVPCTFAAILAAFKVIKQKGYYEYIFELSYSTIHHSLQNTECRVLLLFSCLASSSILKIEVTFSSEMWGCLRTT